MTYALNFESTEMESVPEFYKLTCGELTEYWTSWEAPLTFDGQVYTPASIGRSGFSKTIKLTAISLSLRIPVELGSIMPLMVGTALPATVSVIIYQALLSDLTDYGIIFQGKMKKYAVSKKIVTLQFDQRTSILDNQIPNKLYQSFCNHGVFDSDCALAAASWRVGATLTGVASGVYYTSPTFDTYDDDYFKGGQLVHDSDRRLITAHTGDTVVIQVPFGDDVEFGTRVNAYPGCDGDPDTCIDKFDNFTHFLGHPYIPAADIAVYGVR